MRPILVPVLIAAGILVATTRGLSADKTTVRVVSETSLGLVDETVALTREVVASEDARHIAYFVKGEKTYRLYHSAGPVREFEFVQNLRLSSDGSKLYYEGIRDGRRFSAVGDHVVDTPPLNDFAFSADSKRFGFAAGSLGEVHYFIDGKPEAGCEGIGGLTFSPDSQRVAYLAYAAGKGHRLMLDGMPYQVKGGTPLSKMHWSPDGKRLAYWAKVDSGWNVVAADGPTSRSLGYSPLQPDDDGPWPLSWHPDGTSLAYFGRDATGKYLVVGSEKGKSYPDILRSSLRRSADGSRLGFLAKKGDQAVSVVDGAETVVGGAVHIEAGSQSLVAPVFSADGKRVAFAVNEGKGWGLSLDGRLLPERYDEIHGPSLRFSPDGKRISFTATRGDTTVAVIDGVETPRDLEPVKAGFGRVPAAFSSDSKHFAFQAKRGERWTTVVDGTESRAHDGFIGNLVFDGTRVRSLIIRGREVFRQELEVSARSD